jgi:hypothetical protein
MHLIFGVDSWLKPENQPRKIIYSIELIEFSSMMSFGGSGGPSRRKFEPSG